MTSLGACTQDHSEWKPGRAEGRTSGKLASLSCGLEAVSCSSGCCGIKFAFPCETNGSESFWMQVDWIPAAFCHLPEQQNVEWGCVKRRDEVTKIRQPHAYDNTAV